MWSWLRCNYSGIRNNGTVSLRLSSPENIVSYDGKTFRILATGMRGADAVEFSGGVIYVSSWPLGRVWKFDRKAKETTVLSDKFTTAADFFFDRKNNQLIVPDMLEGPYDKELPAIQTETQQRTTSPKNAPPVHRVWKLDRELKEAVTGKRRARTQTIREFLAEAVEQELPELLNGLAGLGQGGLPAPVRFPMEEATLTELRKASQVSGLDQFQLFAACLRLAPRRKRRRGRVNQKQATCVKALREL